MENIIKKAQEGDYLLFLPYEKIEYINMWLICTLKPHYRVNSKKIQEIPIASIFIDPLFWQALGKACGWGDVHYEYCPAIDYGEYGEPCECDCSANIEWKENALCFHEINLTESFDKAIEYLESIIIYK